MLIINLWTFAFSWENQSRVSRRPKPRFTSPYSLDCRIFYFGRRIDSLGKVFPNGRVVHMAGFMVRYNTHQCNSLLSLTKLSIYCSTNRTAFPLWIIANALSVMMLSYCGITFFLTGVFMEISVIVYAMIRFGTQPMEIPFEDGVMHFDFGPSFWLTMVGGKLIFDTLTL